jgi:hypothetical protein
MFQMHRALCGQSYRSCWTSIHWHSCHATQHRHLRLLFVLAPYSSIDHYADFQIGVWKSLVDVIAPTLRLRIITTPICAVIALNMVANYYWAIKVPPGFADEDVSLSGQRRYAQNSRWPKWTIAPTRAPRHGPDFMHNHELEVGRIGKCTKCGSMKPEVYPTMAFIRDD